MKHILKIIFFSGLVSLCHVGNVCAALGPKPGAETPVHIRGLPPIEGDIIYPESPFETLINKSSEKNHYIHVLDIGDEALLARIHLIRSAKSTIYIQTFIWTNDETGRYVAYELLQAAKRGVNVKIIVDRWKSVRVSELVAFMSTAHSNLEVKTYNPPARQINPSALRLIPEIALKFRQINQRMHNKTFIVDGRIAITGGRNYENDYYDRGVKRNFKDRDVLVIGPVVNDITESFMDYWRFELAVPSKDLIDVGQLMKTGRFSQSGLNKGFDFGNLFEDTDRLASDDVYIQKVFIDKAFAVEKVRFVADKPGKNESFGLRGGGEATVELAKILFQAKESIVAQTPYLVLDRMTIEGVKKLRRKNPQIDILISSNSLAATDNIYAYSFSYKQKKLFVRDLRFRVFELKPVPADIAQMMPRYVSASNNNSRSDGESVDSLSQEKDMNTMENREKHLCVHAKSFVVDNRIAWIGSFNLDPRSLHLNTEVGLIIWDRDVAKAIRDNILRDMAPQNSWTIGKRKEVPLVSFFSGLLEDILQKVPVVDIWPFRYTSSFKLKEGKGMVPFYDDRFYENYIPVGSFPEVGLSLREIEIRLLKAFTGLVMPII